jgi:hypothetical protein
MLADALTARGSASRARTVTRARDLLARLRVDMDVAGERQRHFSEMDNQIPTERQGERHER